VEAPCFADPTYFKTHATAKPNSCYNLQSHKLEKEVLHQLVLAYSAYSIQETLSAKNCVFF